MAVERVMDADKQIAPRSEPRGEVYGYSELKQVIHVVTAWLLTREYNECRFGPTARFREHAAAGGDSRERTEDETNPGPGAGARP